MDVPEELRAAAEEVTPDKTYRVSVRTLLSWFDVSRRRHRVVAKVRAALDAVNLQTFPDFEGEWIDAEIFLVQKGKIPGSRPSHDDGANVPEEATSEAEQAPDSNSAVFKPVDPTRLLERFPRGLVATVHPLLFAFRVGQQFGLSAGPVKVQIGIEVLLIEALDARRVRRRDVLMPRVPADHGAVFRFHQAVVVGVPRTRLGLFDQQLVQ